MHNVDDALNRAMQVLAIDAICKAEIQRADIAIGEADEVLKRIKAQMWGSPAGKTFLAGELIKRFPQHKTYVEPFFGGGAVFWLKAPSESEVIGDAVDDIAFALKFVKGASDDQVKALKGLNWTLTEDAWRKLKSASPSTPAERFHRMVMLRFGAFGRDVSARGGIDRNNIGKAPDVFRKIDQARARLKNVKVVSGDYRKTMKDEDAADAFFFLDPPYVKTGEKDKRGQGVGEPAFDHAAFWKFLGTVKGKFLVTYDTPPPVKGFKVEKLTHRASSGRAKNDAYDTFVITNFGKTPAKKAAPVVKAPPPAEFENVVRLLPVEKAEEDKRIVFGVVLEPGEVDAQGDTISEDEIETAAHEWLAKYQNRGLMHRKLINAKIRIFESYISPADLTIGGQRVKKGTWLLMYHVLDDQIWQQIKSGKLRGFSMGGFARRVQMKAA